MSRHGTVLNQSPSIGLVTSNDDENVSVYENHEDERSKEETSVLPTKAKLSDEIRFASLRLFQNQSHYVIPYLLTVFYFL